MCSGSELVTAYDFESGHPGSNPEWELIYYNYIYYKASITALYLTEPSFLLEGPSGVVHWVPEQLNIKAVIGHASRLMVCSLKTVFGNTFWHMPKK